MALDWEVKGCGCKVAATRQLIEMALGESLNSKYGFTNEIAMGLPCAGESHWTTVPDPDEPFGPGFCRASGEPNDKFHIAATVSCLEYKCNKMISYAMKYNTTEEECRNAGGSWFSFDNSCGWPVLDECSKEGRKINGITPDFYGYNNPDADCSGDCDYSIDNCQEGCRCCPSVG
jgi:hypothetical protein